MPLYFGGATFVTNEIPIGLNNNSANVNTKYVLMSQFGDTNVLLTPPVAFNSAGLNKCIDANAMTVNPKPATIIPRPIFLGDEGSLPFFANAPKTAIETGVKATTKNGLNCWNSCGNTLTVSGILRYNTAAQLHSNKVMTPQMILFFFVSDWNVENKVYTEIATNVNAQMLNPMREIPVAVLAV